MTFKKLLEETKDMNLGFPLVILKRKLPFSHFASHETQKCKKFFYIHIDFRERIVYNSIRRERR